jgi:hypothetical protein
MASVGMFHKNTRPMTVLLGSGLTIGHCSTLLLLCEDGNLVDRNVWYIALALDTAN